MRIATWNLAALTSERLVRLHDWLDYAQPDVLCLQETKLSDDAFPAMEFLAREYEAAHHGQGRWNGVAILSRVGLEDPVSGFGDDQPPDPEARLLTATCGGVRVTTAYVPNGRSVDHEQYVYKLAWLARLRAGLDTAVKPDDLVVLCGDVNIAPADIDVWDPAAFEGQTHVSEPERKALADLEKWGLHDVFREQYPDVGGLFSWWDYRAGNFHKRQGMRIDLILATAPLAKRVTWALIDRNARKGTKPSDHAPVLADFDVDEDV
ncbi:MAG TPA: exodeoxyribonuclease III [Acidimicrobiales bacterium]|jgi:exodeoxyribonuclease-3